LYKEWLEKDHPDKKPVSEWYYRKVFCEDFDLGFEPPRSDTCNFCDKLDNEMRTLDKENDEAKFRDLELKKMWHKRRAKSAQDTLAKFKKDNDPTLAVLCFDLQQAQCTPKLFTGEQYYKRKLWTYNLGVHDVKSGQGFMYVWNETQGGRGSAEVVSILKKHISEQVAPEIKTCVI